jgi:hypothetical protein
MNYEVTFKPRSIKDGKKIPNNELEDIFKKIEIMKTG